MTPALKPALIATLFALLAAPAMAQPAPAAAGTAAAAPAAQAVTAPTVAKHYAALVLASYEDTLAGALTLQKAVQALAATPSDENLKAARKAWLDAREFYGQTEAFRFYGGPIDDKNGPEGREENIATGWHAIEFLLWGQDLSTTGPGNRSFEDFVDGRKPNADRRRQYLQVVTGLLVDDLRSLTKAWAPTATSYRAKFERGGMESVRKIFVGLGSLSRGELAGERLEVALASQDQEDEHSCFSDNTHRDVVNNAKGIQNAWLGQYKRADGSTLAGASLRDLVAAKNPALAERTTKQIAASVAAAEGIQAPFDREIVGAKDAPGRLRVQKTIDSLVQQSKDLVEAANAAGITKLTLVKP
jgi:putative iron-regulated protein